MHSEIKNCQNCKQDFVIESEDFSFYEKIKVPPPTFCPECRLVRRMSWRNERSLYFLNCYRCSKRVTSMYSAGTNFPVYCNECHAGDDWDAREFARDYDFSKSFFHNFSALFAVVPRAASIFVEPIINSRFCNFFGKCKNLYLCFSVLESEDIYYSRAVEYSRNQYDCALVTKSDTGYFNLGSLQDYNVKFSYKTETCIDSNFLFDCVGCQNCFMSCGLRNKSYVFRNKQLTKDAYLVEIGKLSFSSFESVSALKKEFDLMKKNWIHKYANIFGSHNCSGDNVSFSNNSHYVFDSSHCENVKFSMRAISKVTDCYDILGTETTELMYECIAGGFGSYNSKFINFQNLIRDSEYCDTCKNSSNCFLCVGLKNAEYCILNKQYTKEEYFKMVEKIKKHMNDIPYIDTKGRVYKYGEFFPTELSPFCYNETIAQEYFTLNKEQALDKGYRWKETQTRDYNITKKAENLPDDIKDTDESILKEVIACIHSGNCAEQCTTAFRIIPEELSFYKYMGLPLPRTCPNCRYYELLKQRNPIKLWHRQCMKTGCINEFETSYAPDRPEIVYCEKCYQQEVY